MISLPPHPINSSIEHQLSSIENQYTEVHIYDPSDPHDPWKQYIVDKPFGNDLTDLHPDFGIWIKMKNDAILTVDHDVPRPNQPPYEIQFYNGWNFIGYPSVTTRDITDALAGVPYDLIQTYVAETGQWLSYDPDAGSGDLTQLELGRGYMLHATEDWIWQINYV
jgi:hypothetical protein